MLDTDRKYPLGATRISFVAYLAILAAILIGLLVIDAPVAAWAQRDLVATRPFFDIVTIPGNSAWTLVPALAIGVVALVAGLLLPAGRRKVQAMSVAAVSGFVFAGIGVPGLVSNLVKRLVGRARPVHLHELGPLAFRPFQGWDFQSFPSGDTTTAFATAAVILFFFPRLGRIAFAGAALVGFARIALGMHFPSDVYGGVLLGTFGAYAVRNFCLSRGLLFTTTADGRIVADLRRG